MPARLPSDQPAELLLELLDETARSLRRRIRDAAARGAEGTEAYYRAQHAAVRREIAALRPRARAGAQVVAAVGYAAGFEAVPAGASAAAAARFAGVHLDAVQAIADSLAGRVDSAILQVGRSADDAFREAQLQASAEQVAGGLTRRDASLSMRSRLERQGLTSFVDRAGRRWSMEHYTRMAVRTTARQSVTAGTTARMLELDLDLVTISDHNTDTELCQNYEGRTFSLTGRTPGYDVLDLFPPFHPNCQHVLTPASENLDALERSLGLEALAVA